MGQRISSILGHSTEDATLLPPAMQGDIAEVKRLVGTYIADHENTHRDFENRSLSSFVNRTDEAGNAAIHGAVFGGHMEVLKFLVETCGSSLVIKNGLGCSPIWIAAGYEKLDCLEYLVDKVSQILDNSQNNDTATNKTVLQRALLDANTSGDTPLLAAASRGNGACKALLDAVDKYFSGNGDGGILGWEIKRKMLRTANNGGDTPLGVAVAGGHDSRLLTSFLELDDEITKKCSDSVGNNDAEPENDSMTIKSVNRKNGKGLTPLIVACERNLPKVAEILLQHGANIRDKDSNGRHPLSVAAFCGCNDVVEFLLQHIKKSPVTSTLLNETDENGCTPVWLAARTGNVSMTKLLVEAGADLTIKDKDGMTPHDVAVKFKKKPLESYFAVGAPKSDVSSIGIE